MSDLLSELIRLIEGWDDGDEFKARYVNDGGGHFDFMGMKVTERGKLALQEFIAHARTAVIAGMREPTENMISDGLLEVSQGTDWDQVESAWKVMIDRALTDVK